VDHLVPGSGLENGQIRRGHPTGQTMSTERPKGHTQEGENPTQNPDP
jgi:hypothetical protein